MILLGLPSESKIFFQVKESQNSTLQFQTEDCPIIMMHPKKKNSIMSCMDGFIGAVNNMDQTVMVPNLLRDIPLDRHAEMSHFKSDLDEGDLYASYHLLKTLRGNIEWGVKAAEGKRLTRNNSLSSTSSSSSSSEMDEEDDKDDNIEKQFQYHLTGLQGVLSKLTVQANSLTSYYKQRVGI